MNKGRPKKQFSEINDNQVKRRLLFEIEDYLLQSERIQNYDDIFQFLLNFLEHNNNYSRKLTKKLSIIDSIIKSINELIDDNNFSQNYFEFQIWSINLRAYQIKFDYEILEKFLKYYYYWNDLGFDRHQYIQINIIILIWYRVTFK